MGYLNLCSRAAGLALDTPACTAWDGGTHVLEDHATRRLDAGRVAPWTGDGDGVRHAGFTLCQAPQHDVINACRVRSAAGWGRCNLGVLSTTLRPGFGCVGFKVTVYCECLQADVLFAGDVAAVERDWPCDMQHDSDCRICAQSKLQADGAQADERNRGRCGVGLTCRCDRNGARWQCRPRFTASCGDSATRKREFLWVAASLPRAAAEPAAPSCARTRATRAGASGSARFDTCDAPQFICSPSHRRKNSHCTSPEPDSGRSERHLQPMPCEDARAARVELERRGSFAASTVMLPAPDGLYHPDNAAAIQRAKQASQSWHTLPNQLPIVLATVC